jgi:poly(3-hydroxybutyrate) depolymerase
MKTRTLCLVAGIVGIFFVGGVVAAGCSVQDTSTSNCSGYLGCSSHQTSSIGLAADLPTGGGAAGTNGGGGMSGAMDIDAVLPGAGCGKDLPTVDGVTQVRAKAGAPTGYFHWTVQGTGKTLGADQPAKVGPRTFWVRVPPTYDPSKPYKLVFIGQGCGGYDAANLSTLQLFKESAGGSENAIYVALDIPKDNANLDCYDNRDGPLSQEWEAFELFMKVLDANYCVDLNRIYVSGYSTGGWLGNMWGCYFAGDGMNPAGTPGVPRKFAPKYHVRAQAVVTGGEPPNNPPCNGKVAAIWIHDAGDGGNVIQGNIDGLTRVGKMNGCNTKYDNAAVQEPWAPMTSNADPAMALENDKFIAATCKKFTDCKDPDYPVIFCTTNGLGHADQHEHAVPAFKKFFDLLEPK